LVQEWGQDLNQNLGYARHAFEHINPALIQAFDTALASSDDPGALMASATKYLAQTGRMLAHRSGVEISPVKGQKMERRSNDLSDASRKGTGAEQMAELTKQIFEASGSKRTHLAAERSALARRLYGSEPVVGKGGRRV
jgi:hypothetical protein